MRDILSAAKLLVMIDSIHKSYDPTNYADRENYINSPHVTPEHARRIGVTHGGYGWGHNPGPWSEAAVAAYHEGHAQGYAQYRKDHGLVSVTPATPRSAREMEMRAATNNYRNRRA